MTQSDPLASPAYSYTYDASGRATSYNMPNVSYTNVAYDAEGEPKSFAAYGTTIANTYSTRGELTGEAFGSDYCNPLGFGGYGAPQPPAWNFNKSANGFLFPQNTCPAFPYTPWATWDHNLATITFSGTHDLSGLTTSGSAFGYDNSGRIANSTSTEQFSHNGRLLYCSGSTMRSYDGVNHLASIQSVSSRPSSSFVCTNDYSINFYQWGANEKVLRVGLARSSTSMPAPAAATFATVHWDGESMLFVSNANGTVGNVDFDGLAEVYPNGSYSVGRSPIGAGKTFYVFDYSPSGVIVDGRFSAARQTPYYTSDDPPSAYSATVNPLPYVPGLDIASRDMLSDGVSLLSGVRSFESGTTQWSSPDALGGAIDDPLSQRSYMWNRNNPYLYSDPSGYDPSGAACPAAFIGGNGGLNLGGLQQIGCVQSKPSVPTLDMAFGSVYSGMHPTRQPYVGKTMHEDQRAEYWQRRGMRTRTLAGTRALDAEDSACLEGFLINVCGPGLNGRLANKINGKNPSTPLGRAQLTRGMEINERLTGIEVNESFPDPLPWLAGMSGEPEILPEIPIP